MEDIQVSNPALWTTLAGLFGPAGVVLLLTNAGFAYGIRIMWVRLKEKDEECQKELATAAAAALAAKTADQEAWRERATQMRDDIKEAFRAVGELSKQVTILVDRATR